MKAKGSDVVAHSMLPHRTSAITALLNIYDELEALTQENKNLRERLGGETLTFAEEHEESLLERQYEAEFAKVGKRSVYDSSVLSWTSVNRYPDGTYEGLDDFVRRYTNNVPDYMSFRDFCELYHDWLMDDYEERLAKRKSQERNDD